MVLKAMCNTACSELEDKAELSKKEEITVGGIVTNVRPSFTKKGTPCGFVTIEDFKGSGVLALFGDDWGKWRGMLATGSSVYVRMKCQPRFRDSSYLDLRVLDIQYLQAVKDSNIEKITIMLDSTNIDDTAVNDLTTMLKSMPGSVQVYFNIKAPGQEGNVTLRSKNVNIEVKNELISYIEENDDMDYCIN